jgi:hypothetical protein
MENKAISALNQRLSAAIQCFSVASEAREWTYARLSTFRIAL